MAINFDLDDLLAFRAVAELGNFRRAAEAVHISQPAFSRRIDKLEQALGVRLLNRTTRRVELTAVGRDFERKVRQILDDLDITLMGIRGETSTRLQRSHDRLRAVGGELFPVARDRAQPRAQRRRCASRSSMPAPTRCCRRWCAAKPTSASTSSARWKATSNSRP